jgi:ATP/ADP translocase
MVKTQILLRPTQSKKYSFANKSKRMQYIPLQKEAYATLLKMKEANGGKLERGSIKSLVHHYTV